MKTTDFVVLDALTLPGSREDDDGGETSLAAVKRFLTNLVKSAIHRESNAKPSIALKLPYFIVFISLCEILVYCLLTKDLNDAFIYSPYKKCQVWRFLSYMFLHNDCTHLGLNIIIQILLSVPLEIEQDHLRTSAVYFGGGLAGSMGASVFDNESLLVGASGGIYALLMSHISHVVLNYKSLKYVAFRSVAVSVLVLADVAYNFYHFYVFNNESPRIGLAAHFAGAFSGLLLGAMFFKGTSKWTNFLGFISAVIVVVLLVLTSVYNLSRIDKC